MIRKIRLAQILSDIPVLANKSATATLSLNLLISAAQAFYILVRSRYLNPLVPLWYTNPWGDPQLAPAKYLYLIPIISFLLTFLAIFLVNKLFVARSKEALFATLTFLTISTSFLFYSELRIIQIASTSFPPIIERNVIELLPLLIMSLLICAGIVPFVIKLAKKYDIVTDPGIHSHPGMILTKPSARAGAAAFFVAFLIVALIFVPLTRETVGLYIGAFLTTVVGLIDDKKNINPYLRLLILPVIIVLTLVISNLHIYYFANPVDGVMRLDIFQIPLRLFGLKFVFIPIADLFTVVWILWVMNMLSWSNAVDGQFSGMVAITCFITALLALRLLKIDPEQIYVARLSVIAAGASLGILPYNWHPSKIMWGFGAITMGLVISILSIMAGTKVAVATLVLIVPTLDALITIVRRILQRKSPVWGDRGHLHHRLLDMGFSPQKVAIFYWVVTALIGSIALISSGSSKFLALLTIGGVVAFILVAMNSRGELGKLEPPQSER